MESVFVCVVLQVRVLRVSRDLSLYNLDVSSMPKRKEQPSLLGSLPSMLSCREVKSIRADRAKNVEWVKKHAVVRAKYGIKPDFHKWTQECFCRGVPASERSHDLIDLVGEIFQSKLASKGDVAEKDWKSCSYVLDLSQDAAREPFSDKVRSMVSNSSLWYYPRSRALVPKEPYC